MPSNAFFPGLSAENFPAAPTHGVITHVAIHRATGVVTAIGLDNERLDANLGQVHAVHASAVPEIGKPLAGVEINLSPFTGQPV